MLGMNVLHWLRQIALQKDDIWALFAVPYMTGNSCFLSLSTKCLEYKKKNMKNTTLQPIWTTENPLRKNVMREREREREVFFKRYCYNYAFHKWNSLKVCCNHHQEGGRPELAANISSSNRSKGLWTKNMVQSEWRLMDLTQISSNCRIKSINLIIVLLDLLDFSTFLDDL